MRWLLWCFCLLAESYETINHWPLSLPSLGRTVLFLTRSGMRFRHCSSLILLRIAKTVANACAQHAFTPFKYNPYIYEICVACEKWGQLFGTRFKRFLKQWYKALSNCGYSMKNSTFRPTKLATFWPTKDNLFYVTHNDCRRQPLAFKKVKTFLATPKRLVWICHYVWVHVCVCVRMRSTVPHVTN